MNTKHIIIGAVLVGAAAFLWYRSRKASSGTKTTPTATTARAADQGLDITSSYGNESPAL